MNKLAKAARPGMWMGRQQEHVNVSARVAVGAHRIWYRRAQVKAGISAAHLGDQTTAEQHFAVLRALGATDNTDLYLSVANAFQTLGRHEDALPYFQVWRYRWQSCVHIGHVRLCLRWSAL